MSDPKLQPETSPPSGDTPRPKRKSKRSSPRTPRVIDPQVARIRTEASEKIKEYHRTQNSKSVLKTIVGSRLSRLTAEDKMALLEHLKATLTSPPKV